jgi:hypothetical protein
MAKTRSRRANARTQPRLASRESAISSPEPGRSTAVSFSREETPCVRLPSLRFLGPLIGHSFAEDICHPRAGIGIEGHLVRIPTALAKLQRYQYRLFSRRSAESRVDASPAHINHDWESTRAHFMPRLRRGSWASFATVVIDERCSRRLLPQERRAKTLGAFPAARSLGRQIHSRGQGASRDTSLWLSCPCVRES